MIRYSKIGQYVINWDEIYYIAYSGRKRELAAKDQKEYDNIMRLPFELQRKELRKFGFEKNPNLVPIKGLALVEILKDAGFIPFFDDFFSQSHLLQVDNEIVFEMAKIKSYELMKTV